MSDIHVTVRLPRDVFEGAMKQMRAWGCTPESESIVAGHWTAAGSSLESLAAAYALFRVAVLEGE